VDWWRVRQVVNATNGSTLLGLALGVAGGVRWHRGPRGLLLGTGYRFGFPVATAFTVGDVVLTHQPEGWWAGRDLLLVHEERHTWQYAVTLGLPMLPMYAVAAGWSWLRGGDWSTYNAFEVRAGLSDGGYPALSRRQRRRHSRTA
jgi:hypothetical protein